MANQSQRPIGQRHSFTYMQQSVGVKDSKRLRVRLASAFHRYDLHQVNALATFIRAELGVKIPIGDNGALWNHYFEKCEPRDLLDTITLVARALPKDRLGG